MTDQPIENRRPLASRQTALAHRLSGLLLRTRVTPDQISAAGLACAALAGALLLVPSPAALLAAAVLIQLRLLANLLDGLVAVEGGRAGPFGPLWNEMPDRLADVMILVGFGIAAGTPMLGLAAALAAVLTAYVRLLGGSLGLPQSFIGPMAKQHRMAAVTAGCVAGATELALGRAPLVPAVVLWIVLAGTLVTVARRTLRLAAALRTAP
jgi:phosphatidylglycerophosphate synthase